MPETSPDQHSLSDFIFGTLATDALRLQHIVATRSGLAHELRNAPRDPLPGQAVHIHATAGPAAPIVSAFVHYTTDGSQPALDRAATKTIPMAKGATSWDTLLWSYLDTFNADIPRQASATIVRYQISGLTSDGRRLWVGDEHGERQTFSYNVDSRLLPTWVQNAVIYHIFMDRFAPTPGTTFAKHDNLGGFFGGTLKGVLSKLGYLSDLGVTALWLSPIFPSPSHHGYDSTDFRDVEPRYGTKNDLRALIDELHQRDMKLILDFVPNHTSDEHPHFVAAKTDPNSPYRDFYTFTAWPDEYATFFGVKTLPQINNEVPAARRYVIDSARYWLDHFGVDGFRLDYAYGPSHDFWTDYYSVVKNANSETFHFGEIVETPALLRSYEGVMDGALDFLWLQAARKLFAYGTSDCAAFEQFVSRHEQYFSSVNFSLPSFLDNHDINRFLWIAGGDTRKLKQAALCQFTLSAPPIIYYGTEIGLSQQADTRHVGLEASRTLMLWEAEAQDRDVFAFYQRLIAFRKRSTALKVGARTPLVVDPSSGCYGYLRSDYLESVAVLFNLATEARSFTLPSGVWQDAFTDATHTGSVTLPALGTLLATQQR
jgi:cyclomaltodextrinase / maltogenic alpha-amylase / neopullulanase